MIVRANSIRDLVVSLSRWIGADVTTTGKNRVPVPTSPPSLTVLACSNDGPAAANVAYRFRFESH